MAKITRIKAGESSKKKDPSSKKQKPTPKDQPKATPAKAAVRPAKSEQPSVKEKAKTPSPTDKPNTKKPFILFRPFVALGRYLKNSWLEIRQVRWPNRKATWKMVLAVFVYTLMFIVLIALLDLLFSTVFNIILK